MTITEAIDRYTNNAEYERRNGSLQGCMEFRQLAEWLKDYKRLLEQEPVLDKIRAEIDQITDTMGVSYNQYVSKIDVLKIIDKYRAESEVEDADNKRVKEHDSTATEKNCLE